MHIPPFFPKFNFICICICISSHMMTTMHIPELGDCIGVESCADLQPAADYALESSTDTAERRRLKHELVPTKPFPPRIPTSVAMADNVMPWVMTKYYTEDGSRLVIVEEKVRRHEYIHAHRSDGRLVMTLVPMEEDSSDYEEEEEEQDIDGGDEADEIDVVDEGEIGDPVPEQCKYNRLGVSPCGARLAVPPPPQPLST